MTDSTRIKVFPGARRATTALVAGLLLLFFISGCGYHPAASAGNRLDSSQSIWVAFIENQSISSTAQTVLRRALLEEAHIMRGIAPANSFESADLQVSGSLRSYSYNGAISYTANDQVKQYRLTIVVELELRSRIDNKLTWKGVLDAYQDYPVNSDLALQHSAEEEALVAASHKLARKFLTTVEQSY